MAKCVYILRTPGGEKIIIPADFGSLELDDDKAIELINNYKSAKPSERNDALNELVSYIKENTKVTKINKYVIEDALNKDKISDIIKEINQQLEYSTTYKDFSKALKNYLYKNPEKYNEINERINRRLLPSDFKNLDTNKVLGVTSLNNEISKLDLLINENRTQGFDYTFLDNIKKFLEALHTSRVLNKDKNVLISFSTEYGLKSINVDEYSFFKEDNPSSLFLSLFKRAGNSVDTDSLNNILVRYKITPVKTSKEFFDNVAEEAINPSMFEKLLESKENNKIVSEIIKLVTNRLDSTNSLYSTTKSVFQNLNPNSYGYNVIREIINQQQFLEMEKAFSSEYNVDKIKSYAEAINLFDYTKAKDDLFSEMIKLDNVDYKYIVQNVSIGKDLLMVPRVDETGKKHFNPYIIQNIFPKNNGVYIVSLYKDQEGNYKYFKKAYLPGDELFIRKRENPKIPYDPDAEILTNDNLVELRRNFKYLSRNDLQEFIKDNAMIGDKTDIGTVVGVYPAYLYVKSGDEFIKQAYSDVKNFNSAKLGELYKVYSNVLKNFNYNAYTEIRDVNLISKDDIIVDPTSTIKNKAVVVYSNPDYVFIIVGNDNKRYIKPISRIELRDSKAWMHSNAVFTSNERKEIIDNVNTSSISARTLSSFFDINKATKGDYFYGKLNGTTVYGKIVDKNKGIIFTDTSKVYETVDISNISNIQFYTPRDISSPYTVHILRVNNWKVTPKPIGIAEQETNLVEVKYIIPNDVDENSLVFFPTGYANIGRYIDKYTDIPRGYKDITNYVKATFFKIIDKNTKLYVTDLNGSRKYQRNLSDLRKITDFNKIPIEEKERINPLKKGVYFTIAEHGSLSDTMYRVMEDVGDEIIAHTNRTNDKGDIITVERIFSKRQLYQTPIKINGKDTTPDGAIYNLYLQSGNSKTNVLLKAAGGILSHDEILNVAGMQDLLDKMKTYFGNYGIDVDISNDSKEFKNNQFAKIKTEVVDDKLKTSILLNGNKGTKSDLVHENLHIFLTLLRYSDYSTYGKVIDSVLGKNENEEDISEREEQFVKAIVNALQGDYITNFLDKADIVAQQLYNVIKKINPDFSLNIERAINNPEELFKSSLKDIFNYKSDISSPYYNVRLIDSEASFREWAKNKIILKCD